MKKALSPLNMILACFLTVVANGYLLIRTYPVTLAAVIAVFLIIILLSFRTRLKTTTVRLIFCRFGANLLTMFALSLIPSVIYHVVLLILYLRGDYMVIVWSAVMCICVSAFVFWAGIISVYCSSVQLGIRWRVIGAVCGMIPIANLVVLNIIIGTVTEEVSFEISREVLNKERADQKVCATKYPILFVHGAFFRDSKRFNYWGRIPKELECNGAKVYYGEHQSARPIADSAVELKERILTIVEETGCEKLNIIAHSKGGLDSRYAIAKLGMAPYVASLTTINTPHRGCVFADRLLNFAPASVQEKVASVYNTTLKKLGDESPDFLAAISDLTASACEIFDKELAVPDPIVRQSFGSKLNKATGGQFPLNLSYRFVKYYDGANDGLVGEDSFAWGDTYTFITTEGKRGISHGDMIDLNRENIPGFDVRELYVGLVSNLRQRGL
ncbi:MAG: triacylglycerol lipase [Clostridia bacterium]|nr:triacylglycerol lipase [Clostridia bacterium]